MHIKNGRKLEVHHHYYYYFEIYVVFDAWVMLVAPSIIADAPCILSEWAKMSFTQVDPYDSYGST